jgi:hypothetical protein
VCDAIPQTMFRWRGPDQESAQEIRDGVGKMIDDAQQIANDGFTPAYGRAIQLDDTYAKRHFPDCRSLHRFHDFENYLIVASFKAKRYEQTHLKGVMFITIETEATRRKMTNGVLMALSSQVQWQESLLNRTEQSNFLNGCPK